MKVGDNFLGRNGQRMVLTNIKTIGDQSLYELIHESGKRQTYSSADMKGLEKYTGKKKISAKTATSYANKWDEMDRKMSEYYKKARETPSWSYEDKLKYFNKEVDPIVKSLNGYKANISKTVGHTADFDPAKAHSLNSFNVDERGRIQNKISENQRSVEDLRRNLEQPNTNNTVNRNLEAGDTVDINTGDIKKADGTIIKKDGTVIRPNSNVNPQQGPSMSADDYFKNLNGSAEDIFNNFDNHFNEYLYNNPGLSGPEQMKAYNDLRKRYEDEANKIRGQREREKAQQERQRNKEEMAKQNKYENGQVKSSVFDEADGSKIKAYYDENGNITKQVIDSPDGKRDISLRRSVEDMRNDPSPESANRPSRRRIIKDGDVITIADSPDPINWTTKTIDKGKGTIRIQTGKRARPWSGGVPETDTTMSLDEYYKQRKKEIFPDRNQTLNNNFRGNRTNRTNKSYTQQDVIDRIIGKQNPGANTSRVFDYNGNQYAIYKNLEINSKDLSKGLIRGTVVDVNTNKTLSAEEAFADLNQALKDGDLDTAMNELNKIKSAGYTLPREEVEEFISKGVDGQSDNQQQAQNEQQRTIDNQHEQTETEHQQQHAETKNEMNENHESNKKTATKGNTSEPIEPEIDTPETPNNAPDLPDAPDAKTRSQRLKNARKRLGKDITKDGKTTRKHFTGQRVANNSKRSIKKRKLSGKKFRVKGGNLKQAVASTFVNVAKETVTETIAKNADELKKIGKHPNLFKDLDEFADLTDADIDYYYDNLFGMDTKTKKEMKKKWVEKRKLAKTARESAKKRKIIDEFDDYMNNHFSYSGYSSIEGQARFNPDPDIGWDEVDYRNPESYTRRRIDFEVDENGNVKMNKFDDLETVDIEQNKIHRRRGNAAADDDIFGWMKKHKIGLGEAINVLSSISVYKDERKQGRSVASSAVRAAGSFIAGEMLGFWGYMGLQVAKGIPKLAIKGAETLYKENRKMNSAANQVGLGGNFQDTQQLATMRQSGMEMAKMAQYNLQQTLMGNEATYLHR